MVNIIYHFFIYHYLWVSNTYWPDQPGKWFSKLIPKSRNVTMLPCSTGSRKHYLPQNATFEN